MRPYVLDGLEDDLINYGRCVYSIKDDDLEFSVVRYDPTRFYYGLETN